MADDDEDISTRTDVTKSAGGEGPSRSCTATPTPVSRVPVAPLIAEDVSGRSGTSLKVPGATSARFGAEESIAEDVAAVDVVKAGSAMETDESQSGPSRRESISSEAPSTQTTSQRLRQIPLAQNLQAEGELEDLALNRYADGNDSHESDLEAGSEESSEESADESEEEELSESEEDSSFEDASESSDDDIPLRKPSGRRSTATRQSPIKSRKSSVKPTAAIAQVLNEEDDLIVPKSSRRSATNIQDQKPEDEGVGQSPAAPRSPLNEIRVQESMSPLKGMATLQLKETEESLDLEQEPRPEPVKKKKRLVERCLSVYRER